MATDIFGNDSRVAGSWQLDEAVLSFESDGTAYDIIAIGFQMQYGRQITPYRPLNQKGTILIGGQGTGSLQVTALVGPNTAIKKFIEDYAKLCSTKTAKNTITVKPGGVKTCDVNGKEETVQPVTFIANGAVLTNLQVSVTSIGELSVINTALNMLITGLEIKG